MTPACHMEQIKCIRSMEETRSKCYISWVRLVKEWFDPDDKSCLDPIPVKRLGDSIFMTDGHPRAMAATIAGWDDDDLDRHAYETNMQWCNEEGIRSPKNLARRIVSHKDYEYLWRRRCMEGK